MEKSSLHWTRDEHVQKFTRIFVQATPRSSECSKEMILKRNKMARTLCQRSRVGQSRLSFPILDIWRGHITHKMLLIPKMWGRNMEGAEEETYWYGGISRFSTSGSSGPGSESVRSQLPVKIPASDHPYHGVSDRSFLGWMVGRK